MVPAAVTLGHEAIHLSLNLRHGVITGSRTDWTKIGALATECIAHRMEKVLIHQVNALKNRKVSDFLQLNTDKNAVRLIGKVSAEKAEDIVAELKKYDPNKTEKKLLDAIKKDKLCEYIIETYPTEFGRITCCPNVCKMTTPL